MKATSLFAVLFSFMFTLGLQAQNKNEEVTQLMKEKNYKKADKILNELITQEPVSMRTLLQKGRTEWYFGEQAKSFTYVNQAIQAYPDSAEPWVERAESYTMLVEYGNCIKDADKALTMLSNIGFEDTLKQRALSVKSTCNSHLNRFDEAIEGHKTVLKYDSTNIPSLNDLAMTYERLKRNDEAIELLYKIIDVDSSTSGIYSNLGFVLMSQEKYTKALEIYEKAERMNPKSGYVLNNMGWCLYKLNRIDEAIKSIEKSLKYFKGNSYAYYYLGQIYESQKDLDKACEAYNTALKYGFTDRYGEDAKVLYQKSCISVK